MRRFYLAMLLVLFASVAFAEVKVTVQKDYYDVPGSRKDEILENMKKHAPFKEGKFFVPAYIQPKLRYKFLLGKTNGRCQVKDAIVELEIFYKYPRLSETPANKYASDWWRRQINGLITHEEVHGDIAIRGAHRLEKALLAMDDLDCETAEQQVIEMAKQYNIQSSEEQASYDRRTKHGLRQFLYKEPPE